MKTLCKVSGIYSAASNVNKFIANQLSANGLVHLGEASMEIFLMLNPEYEVGAIVWNLTTIAYDKFILKEKE